MQKFWRVKGGFLVSPMDALLSESLKCFQDPIFVWIPAKKRRKKSIIDGPWITLKNPPSLLRIVYFTFTCTVGSVLSSDHCDFHKIKWWLHCALTALFYLFSRVFNVTVPPPSTLPQGWVDCSKLTWLLPLGGPISDVCGLPPSRGLAR